MSIIVSTLCIALKGREMYSAKECENNPALTSLEVIHLEEHKPIRVRTRNTKPCILRINLSDDFLPKDKSYTSFRDKCITLAQQYNGTALNATFPWEGNSKYEYGELLVFSKEN